MAQGQSSSIFKRNSKELQKLTSGMLKQAVDAGDELVTGIILKACRSLGKAIGGYINLLSPDVIILGGGVIEALGDLMLPAIEAHARAYAFPAAQASVRFVAASLGDDACGLGAACMARDSLARKK